MRNRPRDFVLYECSQWSSASEISSVNIIQTCPAEFTGSSVDSDATTSATPKRETMHECECYDWQKIHGPCKYMFALFQHTAYTWQDFCSSYRDSP